ncbi:MAG: hypothetical protein QMD92_00985 [bacterium]|nr:hypothetical protein [bacterium]
MITFNDFKNIELRTATIKDVADHPKADKLYILTLDVGNEEKQCVAGIRAYYEKEELIGKQIVIVNNLEPATIRGVKSSAMVLAAVDKEALSIVVMDRKIENGLSVI